MAENTDTTSDTSTDGDSGQDNGTTKQVVAPTPNGTLTQAQVDAIVKDRIAREREKYKGFDDLKRKAEDYDKLQAANLSEAEKLQKSLEAANEKASTAESRMKKALTRAAIVSAASQAGARDPNLVVKLIDSDALEITEDGEVKGAEDAVTALLASHDYLKGGGFTASGDGGQRTSAGLPSFTRDQIADPTFYREHKDEITLAARQGRITDG
jgi:hypothetical protein